METRFACASVLLLFQTGSCILQSAAALDFVYFPTEYMHLILACAGCRLGFSGEAVCIVLLRRCA